MKRRIFVLLGGSTPEDLIDRAQRHGEVVSARMHRSPAGEAVYGFVELSLKEGPPPTEP